VRPRLHDTTGWMFVYTMQPVVQPRLSNRPSVEQPIIQPVECLYTRYKRLSNRLSNWFDNWLYRVNGV